ncbi:MAG: TonB-dependent receptor [Candidatus Kapaibacterium sp.]|jgi:hypothetical protein
MKILSRSRHLRVALSALAIFSFTQVFAFGTAARSLRLAQPSNVIEAPDSADAVIAGYVKDSLSGETLIGATVQVRSLKRGAITNKSGYFAIHLPSNQDLIVEITYLGYKSGAYPIRLKSGEQRRETFALSQKNVVGKEITVEADKDVEHQEQQISRVDIQPAQLQAMPKAGEADLFRLLQMLPGVLTASEISSGLYIRGGSPDQNLVLLDGAVLYNPSHFFGFFSTFNSDAIKNVELIKGGFPVEYGGRASAVLSVTNKDGDLNRTNGKVSLGLISSRATIETPIGDGALSLSGRRTYIDVLLKATGLAQSLNIPDYHFFDLNGKFTQTLGPNDKIALSGYGGSDDLTYTSDKDASDLGINWGNEAGSIVWTHVLASDLFTKFLFTGSRYYSTLLAGSGANSFTWNNEIRDFSFYGSLEYFLEEEHQIKVGFQASAYQFQLKIAAGNNPPNADLLLKPFYGAAYIQDEWKINERATVTAGVRADAISAKSVINFDPRISARYMINGDVTVKASVGVYHQYLKLATNPTLSFFDIWLPVDSTQEATRAIQYILGVSTIPFDGYTFDVEAYYKDLTNLVEIRPNIVAANNLHDIFFVGSGRAYGIEFFLQKQIGDFVGWFGYTLSWTRRTFADINDGAEFYPSYDRRNDVNLTLTYKVNDRWTLGANFTYGSGQPYSQIVSEYGIEEPDRQHGIMTVQGQRNALRLPPYNRMDFSATYSFSLFSDSRNATLDFDFYNLYNHRNTWIRQVDASTNPATISDVKLLPILPTIGLQFTF